MELAAEDTAEDAADTAEDAADTAEDAAEDAAEDGGGSEVELAGTRLRIWRGRLPGEPAEEDLRVLSAEETARYRSFPTAVGAARYAAAHAAVRRRLAPLLGTRPEAVVFGRTPCPTCGAPAHGRPRITYPPTSLELSLSRTGAYWLCAVAEGAEVGADIERLRPSYVPGLTRAVLSPREQAYVAAARPDGGRSVAFTRCWTRKEAVVKASGVGVSTDLRRVEVRPDLPVAVVRHRAAGPGPAAWMVRDLPAGQDHLAAVAVAAPGL
ncbi:4'-phosphopantetheinyl transferase superfamily protein [Streptomyces sp. NPDC051211]|uniref:4'-phosphopantetheinyl transferase family protein n=1 Tax=Streptomyces sp. NPDC051211 TaxID=3154643 RepID=UPI00345072EA